VGIVVQNSMIFLYNLCKTTNSHRQPETPFDLIAYHPLVAMNLIDPLRTLVSRLSRSTNTKVPLFFAFDEVSNLTVDGPGSVVFVALRRVIQLLRLIPVWAFALSTQSALDHLAPAMEKDPHQEKKMLREATKSLGKQPKLWENFVSYGSNGSRSIFFPNEPFSRFQINLKI